MPIFLHEFLTNCLIIIIPIIIRKTLIVQHFLGTIDKFFGTDFRITIGIKPVEKWRNDRLVNLKWYRYQGLNRSEFRGFCVHFPKTVRFHRGPQFWLTVPTVSVNFVLSLIARLKVSSMIVHQLSKMRWTALFGDAWAAATKKIEIFISKFCEI